MFSTPTLSLLLVGLATSLSTWLGGFVTLRLIPKSSLIFGLTSGFVLGLALFDLLPEALEARTGTSQIALVFALALLGLVFSLALHHLPEVMLPAASAGRIALIVHSLLDGIGIGLAFQISSATGWIVAGAVLAHDMADGANMAGLSMIAGTARSARRWLLANAAAPLLGIGLGHLLPMPEDAFALLLGFFAGGFIYIGAFELFPRSAHDRGWIRSAIACMAGLACMAGVVSLAHDLHHDDHASAQIARI